MNTISKTKSAQNGVDAKNQADSLRSESVRLTDALLEIARVPIPLDTGGTTCREIALRALAS